MNLAAADCVLTSSFCCSLCFSSSSFRVIAPDSISAFFCTVAASTSASFSDFWMAISRSCASFAVFITCIFFSCSAAIATCSWVYCCLAASVWRILSAISGA